METATGKDRWWSSPEHRPCWSTPSPSFRRRRACAPGQSAGGRTPRKCASRASRWHRPASIAGPARESPCGRASRLAPTGRLRYRAGSLGKSVARTPSLGIARHSTAFAPSVAAVARNNPRECAPWQKIHELGEQRLADIHERLLGKTPNSARSSSNRHHSFAPASYCQINPFQNALAVNRTAVSYNNGYNTKGLSTKVLEQGQLLVDPERHTCT